MKKKIFLLIFLILLLVGATLTFLYWDPILDWLPIDQSGWDVTDNRGRCYLDEDGDPLTGWQTIDGEIYYFDPDSSAMQIRWLEVGGKTYYLGDDGVRRTGWQIIDGGRYYLGVDGVMVTGWQEIDGHRYYMGSGAMVTGWVEDAGARYYLDADGKLYTGWLEQPEGKYYLNENGNPHTGWLELEGDTYYLDEQGVVEIDFAEPAPFKPGFAHFKGYLYYVQEDGHFLKNGNVGLLQFGANGRYTSGDEELDGYVAEILDGIIEANPGKDRFGLLRAAYDYCVVDAGFKYLKRNIYKTGHTGWEVSDAKLMFETGRGNCYNFAAAFWALARGLGYEAYGLAGTCTKTNQPHGWVQIAFDGEDFFFDPEWHWDYINDKREVKDMFKISLEDADWWYYKWVPVKKGA